MALISCPECNHQVSDSAQSCPNCGFTLKPPPIQLSLSSDQIKPPSLQKAKSKSTGCTILIAIACGLIVLQLMTGSESNTKGSSGTNTSSEMLLAYTYSEDCVKKILKAPATAKFPGILEKAKHIKSLGQGRYQIISWVDSQNGFGALLRSKFVCIIKINTNSYQCEDVALF